MEPVIEVQKLVTHYGERQILSSVNMTVSRGETMVILGGSGSGKSTLLRHIIGLERATSGSVRLFGQDICDLPEEQMNALRRKMGMAFQGSALFNSMTVGDNVALPLREHTQLEESTIEIMTKIKLEHVGLVGYEDHMPAQLSGGMKKRAGIARALAMDPEVLLFDEPSAGLDPVIAAGIDHLILKLKSAFGMTVVVVTHEMESAFLIADRITMLDKGRVIAAGTRDELRACRHPRVKQFLNRVPDPDAAADEKFVEALLGEENSESNAGQPEEPSAPV